MREGADEPTQQSEADTPESSRAYGMLFTALIVAGTVAFVAYLAD
jgi:hypothetical protein